MSKSPSAALSGRSWVGVLHLLDARLQADGEHGLLSLAVNRLNAVRPTLSTREDQETNTPRVLPAPGRHPPSQSEDFTSPSAFWVRGGPEYPRIECIPHNLPGVRRRRQGVNLRWRTWNDRLPGTRRWHDFHRHLDEVTFGPILHAARLPGSGLRRRAPPAVSSFGCTPVIPVNIASIVVPDTTFLTVDVSAHGV